jgi:hypothetical protein
MQTRPTNEPKKGTSLPHEVVQAASCGWRLLPICAKRQSVAADVRIEEAACDLEQLQQWAIEHPGSNWGLATGQAFGVFVLEMHAALGANAPRGLCDENWDEGAGIQSRAGEIGYAFFRWPMGMTMRRSAKNLGPGLSLRGEGDYVLVPPSACSAGTSHAYTDPDAAIASAPEWLLNSAFSVESAGKTFAFPQSAPQLAPFAANAAKPSGRLLPFPSRRYSIYMTFEHREGVWYCKFRDIDHLTVLPRVLELTTPERVVVAAERGGGVPDEESRHALERALGRGVGGVFLRLSQDQYELFRAG